MTTLTAPVALARSRPATNASYSTSLLVVGNSRRTIHSTVSPSGDNSTMPTPPPTYLLDDPFVYMLQWGDSSTPLSSSWVNSAIKSATTYPLMVVRGRYQISNSLNSIAHNASWPATSRLLITQRKGLSVRTFTVWAWKYGLSMQVVVTNAKASFSIDGYFFGTAKRSAYVVYGLYTLSTSLTKAALTAAEEMAR